MTLDELETLLRAWGRCMGERHAGNDDERDAVASHPLARGMEMAPGKRQVVIRERTAMHRAGQDRRAYMASQMVATGTDGTPRMRVLPAWAVDPVTATETRSYRDESRDWPIPPEIARVEREALALQAFDDLRGRCLRARYCMKCSDEERVMRMMSGMESAALARIGGYLRLKRFRDEVAYARVWMHGRLAG